ncbi:MAG TPA: nucleotide disphospho-sugar-binding domain-containing protein [Polyangiaceae bacterium]
MAKVMIWPDIYKEQGHWLPCVSLAKTLEDAGYAVEFMGIRDCKSITDPYVADFRVILESIYPSGHSLENKLEPVDQRWKPHHVFPICRGALDTVFQGAGAPNLLVSGYFTGLETLLIHYKYNVPFVIITTFLRHPQDTPAAHAKTKLVYMDPAVSRKIMDLVAPTPGMSIEEFVAPLTTAKEMIPCAKEFDFTDSDWVHPPHVKYVEPMILRQLLGTGPAIVDPVPVPSGSRLIFGTSGSQVQDYEFRARVFFKALIAMMKTAGMESSYLALAVGSKLLAELKREYGVGTGSSTLPSNVFLADWVSQLDVMKLASVVFMHGGLATIKESIWEQVPIVIVPHGKDQVDNALRIRRAGVGVVSEIGELTPTDLRQLLTAATASTFIKRNLARMQGIFQAAENATTKPSLTVVSGVLPP